ncbi:MAG: VOC family protein [Acidobacteriota bacterium]
MVEETSAHPPGNFCWIELATTDTGAAKDFYTGLFGWQADDMPIPDGTVYTILRVDGKDVGALYPLGAEQKAQGVPPNWLPYVAVPSADEAAGQAAGLGGKIVMPPFDVFDIGRMSIIQDPTGATFALWQAKTHKGAGHVNTIGGMCWHELSTNDTKVAEDFYTSLFGWEAKHSANPGMEYTEWINQGKHIGGLMKLQWEAPPNWLTYFMVESCDKSAGKAEALGGKLMVPPMDIPGTGRFSVIADPQGAVFSLFEPASKSDE